MKKLLLLIFWASATYSYAQTINAEQIKKDNYTIKGNILHQLRADTSILATKYYVDSVSGGSSFDTTSLSNRIDLKVDSVKRHTGTDSVFYYTNGTEHFGFIDSVSTSTISAAAWSLTGNVGTIPGTNFIGPIDSVDWVIKTNNSERARVTANGNVGIGTSSPLGRLHVKGIDSLKTSQPFIVKDSKDSTLFAVYGNGLYKMGQHDNDFVNKNTRNLFIGYYQPLNMGDTCIDNTCIGDSCGANITKAQRTTALGAWALATLQGHGNGGLGHPDDFGYENVAVGYNAFRNLTTGYENTAVGSFSGFKTTTGFDDSFFGLGAGQFNTTGNQNTYIGVDAGNATTTGSGNTALGTTALMNNLTSNHNIAVGLEALFMTTGARNVGIGVDAAYFSSSGNDNTYLGFGAGFGMSTGSNNVMLGTHSGFYGNWSNTVIIDNQDRGSTAKQQTQALIFCTATLDSSTQAIRLNGTTQTLGLTDLGTKINTTAGDTATINAMSGKFRKDTSGATFTLTNSYITANSKVFLQIETTGLTTGNEVIIVPGSGSAVITFQTSLIGAAAPSTNTDVSFFVVN